MSQQPNQIQYQPEEDQIIWKLDDEGDLRAYHVDDPETPAVWAPQPGPQTAFMSCPVSEVLFAGTRGNGKTDALLMDFAQHVGIGFKEDWRGILFRRTFPELKDVIAKANKWFPQIFPTATYNKSEHQWTFPQGEVLIFAFMEKEEDYWKHHGHSFSWIGWEELTNWPTDVLYKRMFSTNRSSNKAVPRKIRATCNPHGCVPYGDVLTTEGWVPIQDVKEGERVVSVTETGDLTIKKVAQFHKYGFDGELIKHNFRGKSNIVFTDNHRWPQMSTDDSIHRVREFSDLPQQATIRRAANSGSWKPDPKESITEVFPGFSRTTERREIKWPVPSLPIKEYAELLGWVISEGCVCERDGAFCIAQNKLPERGLIRSVLDRCGFHYREDPQAFWVSERYWMMHFAEQGKCRDKFIPRWFLNQPTEILQICFDAMMLGDGCRNTYYTISKQLADDVAELLVKLGWSVSRATRSRKDRVGPTYSVNFLRANNFSIVKDSSCERVPYKGNVYCLTVPGTETFILRQGQVVVITGNSGHNWCKARFNLPVAPGRITTDLIKTPGEPDRIAVHGHVRENKILLNADPDYIQKLKAACSSPAEEAAWIDGSWDITSGGMFDDIWEPLHHVLTGITPQMIPRHWRIDRSYDHGQSKPFSVGWWAQSNGEPITLPSGCKVGQVPGDLIRIQEWYGWDGKPNKGLRMTATEIAIGLRERQREMGIDTRVYPGVADGSIFDQWEPGKSVAGDMRKKGVRWLRADKGPGSRIQGWQQIRKLLKQAKPNEGHRELPGLFISDLCTQFLRTFPVLSRAKKDPDDVDTDIEDHIADEVRYRCRARQAKRTMAIKG
jgi:hypothetical protein